jgi:hypothetical protein
LVISYLQRIDEREAVLVGVECAIEVVRRDLAVPARGAIVHGALGSVFRRGEEVRVFQRILNGLDVRMGIGEEFRNPPAFDAAFRKQRCKLDQAAFGDRRVKRRAHGIDPHFRRDVRLALFVHGGKGRHRVAGHQRDRAAIAVFEDELVDMRGDARRGPVHFGDRDFAAFCRLGRTGKAVKAGSKDGGSKELLHG